MGASGAEPRHVAVVGGGIAGLAAAYLLRHRAGERLRVTVLEGSPRVGGKLRVSEVAGVPVDEGADAILMRRSEGRDLARSVGLGDQLVPSGAAGAAVWTGGGLRPLPVGQVMGIPADLAGLARCDVLPPAGLARAALDLVLPRTAVEWEADVRSYVASRVGASVVDRLVDPLLGGVYAGQAELLSLSATLPELARVARAGGSLVLGARELRARTPATTGPVFATLRRGLGALPDAVARASGAAIRTGTTVRELRRRAGGWRLTLGAARAPESVDADAVVVAVPAAPAARLLARDVPGAAADLGSIDCASVAVVTLAYRHSAFPVVPETGGYLVPSVFGRTVKAATFATTKWPHLAGAAPGTVIVRCSMGRYGEEHVLQRSDAELVAAAMTELATTMWVRELPLASRVSRWGGALPQYTVGHLERVARIRAAVTRVPGLAVCGAAYDGLGVPACIATADRAAGQVLEYLAGDGRRGP